MSFRCDYIARQIAVKDKYALSVTAAEKTSMTGLLTSCDDQRAPSGGGAVVAAGFGAEPSPAAVTGAPAPAPVPGGDVSYANCAEVRAAGAAPIMAAQPGYSRKLDRDGDGTGCE
jgi:hypothetical protein